MQAYQSPPCPYCGATWNQPGAQACANCRNPLPPSQPGYAPPGYAPAPGQGQQPPAGAPGSPYGAPDYGQAGYPPAPPAYGGYPGQPAGQPGYPGYAPPGYGQGQGYPQQPAGYGPPPGYPGYAPSPAASPSTSTTLQLFGQSFQVPVALPPVVVQNQQRIANAVLGLLGLVIVLFGVLPAVASSQIAGADQAVAASVAHQPKVDAGFASFFGPDNGSNDLNVVKAQAVKDAGSIDVALATVQADEAALAGADQRLSVLQVVSLPSASAITQQRQRLKTALD